MENIQYFITKIEWNRIENEIKQIEDFMIARYRI